MARSRLGEDQVIDEEFLSEDEFSERHPHSFHDSTVHNNISGTPSDGQRFEWSVDSSSWTFANSPSAGSNKERPETTFLGSLMDYPYQTGAGGAYDIQYTRVWLYKDATVCGMEAFVETSGTQTIRMALYNQSVPLEHCSEPSNKIVETPIINISTLDAGTFKSGNFATEYVIQATGYYWIAFWCSSTASKFAGSSVFRANYLPRYEEEGSSSTFPATASGLSNPQSSCIYTAVIRPVDL